MLGGNSVNGWNGQCGSRRKGIGTSREPTQSVRNCSSVRAILRLPRSHCRQQRVPVWPESLGNFRITVQARNGRRDGAARECHCAGEALDEDQAQGIDVGRRSRRRSRGLLGAEVVRGTDRGSVCGESFGVDDAGDTEIGELRALPDADVRWLRNEYVGRFDVPVHHPSVVNVGECFCDLDTDPCDIGTWHRSACAIGLERRTVDQFHDQVRHRHPGGIRCRSCIVQCHQAGMRQRRKCPNFGVDASRHVLRLAVAEDFHCHGPAEHSIIGRSDVRHRAASQNGTESIATREKVIVGAMGTRICSRHDQPPFVDYFEHHISTESAHDEQSGDASTVPSGMMIGWVGTERTASRKAPTMRPHSTGVPISPMSVPITSAYQPIVALDDRSVVGYEALVRTCGEGPPTTPTDLLRAAREQSTTAEFDWRCRATALQGAVEARYPDRLALFVNAEPTALDVPPPPDCLPMFAEASALSIVVEITERDLMGDPAGLLRAAEHARNLGWRVAIDDVGADSTSLALIPLLRPDVIKLDMTIVQGRSTDETAAIVAAVTAEAECTGALVLAEGIETDRHEGYARDMGAVLGQGYLYGQPGSLPDFGVASQPVRSLELNATVTVRAPLAVTPYGVTQPLSAPRHADSTLLDAIENSLLRGACGTGSSTVVLATLDTSTGLTPARAAIYDELAACTALTAVFDTHPAPMEHSFRAVLVGADEPLAIERCVVVVAPMSSAALIAVERGVGDDGRPKYDYRLTYDRHVVLDAATVLLRRIPDRSVI